MWIMMNKKLTTMMFSLLLAVGWTSSASAQLLPGAQERHQEMRVANKAAKAAKHAGTPEKATANQLAARTLPNPLLRPRE